MPRLIRQTVLMHEEDMTPTELLDSYLGLLDIENAEAAEQPKGKVDDSRFELIAGALDAIQQELATLRGQTQWIRRKDAISLRQFQPCLYDPATGRAEPLGDGMVLTDQVITKDHIVKVLEPSPHEDESDFFNTVIYFHQETLADSTPVAGYYLAWLGELEDAPIELTDDEEAELEALTEEEREAWWEEHHPQVLVSLKGIDELLEEE